MTKEGERAGTDPAREPVDGAVAQPPLGRSKELPLRIVSAVTMAGLSLGLTLHSVATFAVLVAGVSLVVAWEWGRIVRHGGIDAIYLATAVGVVAAALLAWRGEPMLALASVVGATMAAGLLGGGRNGRASSLGTLYAGLPVVALVWLRGGASYGLEAVLLVLLVVWATDTGAFIAGRSIGGPKLWASISPNKTWSGLIGGVMAGGAVAWLLASWLGTTNGLFVLGLGMFLAAISQMGDLFESAVKRRGGVKDASRLIPGHGGFMDRVDGLIFAAVAAATLAALVGPAQPGAALLGLAPL